ncbi:unnamed protein product [Meloidogyne enterolobii]|uniref:Uncharacterized protein n=1 Tax=Meloidogyne enterolobii TaxID=390850 RepID=A0ACB1AB68_MELEN
MGNSMVKIPFNEINLVPGNVLIEIDKKYKFDARSRDTGDMSSSDCLIRGRVVRVAEVSPFYNQSGAMVIGHLRVGDEVILYKNKFNSDSLIVFGTFRLPNNSTDTEKVHF